jgi:hypothetical protein
MASSCSFPRSPANGDTQRGNEKPGWATWRRCTDATLWLTLGEPNSTLLHDVRADLAASEVANPSAG